MINKKIFKILFLIIILFSLAKNTAEAGFIEGSFDLKDLQKIIPSSFISSVEIKITDYTNILKRDINIGKAKFHSLVSSIDLKNRFNSLKNNINSSISSIDLKNRFNSVKQNINSSISSIDLKNRFNSLKKNINSEKVRISGIFSSGYDLQANVITTFLGDAYNYLVNKFSGFFATSTSTESTVDGVELYQPVFSKNNIEPRKDM